MQVVSWLTSITSIYCRNEIEKAKTKGMRYDFTHYVLLCKMLRMPPMEGAATGKSKKKQPSRDSWEKVFVNAEEEYFSEVSSSLL